MQIPESMAEQMELAYRTVAKTLAHFNATMSDLVEQRVYVSDGSPAADTRRSGQAPVSATPQASARWC